MAVKVKICGITNEEDAVSAVHLWAQYLGLNVHQDSPRKVAPDVAETIVKTVPPFVTTVGVFVEQRPEEIVKLVRKVGPVGVQLHGAHTPEDARAVAERAEVTLIRAVRVAEEKDLEAIAAFRWIVAHVLLDAKVESLAGGTGIVFPRGAGGASQVLRRAALPGGGLTPENVRQATGEVQPFTVDVASGVEKSPSARTSIR